MLKNNKNLCLLSWLRSIYKVNYKNNKKYLRKEKKIMKKRRLIIGMFLLFAFLGLGIGYAALSNSLTVTGITSAGIDDNNLTVVFEHDASTYATSGCTVYDLTEGTKSARVRVNADALKNLGDVAWAKIKVTNKTTGAKDATLDATLSQPTITPSGSGGKTDSNMIRRKPPKGPTCSNKLTT